MQSCSCIGGTFYYLGIVQLKTCKHGAYLMSSTVMKMYPANVQKKQTKKTQGKAVTY